MGRQLRHQQKWRANSTNDNDNNNDNDSNNDSNKDEARFLTSCC